MDEERMRDLSLPVGLKPFRIRTREAWAAFLEGEGELRALMEEPDGVAAGERLASLPELPTATELGVSYVMSIWAGIFGPKGLPAPVVTKLSDALDKALDDPGVRMKINALGGSIPGKAERNPAAFDAYVKGEIARWEPILKAAGEPPK